MVDIKKYYRGIAIINFIKDEIARSVIPEELVNHVYECVIRGYDD
jgi:hypothetical protein